MEKETNPKINIWAKHSQTIKTHKVKTIKALVAKLKPGEGKIPSIKGIGKNDAVIMLTDIGLSAVPFAGRYKNRLLSKFNNAPEKVDYQSLISSLEEITREEDINEKEQAYIEEAIKKAKSLKDPFKDTTLLSEHRITAPVFRKTIIDEIASSVNLEDKELHKLQQKYKSLDILIKSKNYKIKRATGIDIKKIKLMKDIADWTKFEHVSVPIAHAFVIKNIEPQTIIETSAEDVEKTVKDSGIKITRKELNDIEKVKEAVRKKMPAEAYYFDVISSLNLPKAAHEYTKKKKINNFYDLLKNGGPDNLIKKGKIKNRKLIENIEAYTFLDVLSNDIDINNKLINKRYNAPFTIAKKSRSKFISDMKTDLGNSKATLLWDKALKQTAYLNNIATGIAADSANSYSNGLNATFNFAPTQTCKCNDSESAVSPLAYLADLLRYTLDNVTHNEDNIQISDLTFYLHQPFDQLPASGESFEKEVRQARIAIEVLRERISLINLPEKKQKELQAAEENYCLSAYRTLLMRIGTNLEEIRLSRMADDEEKQDIANKLALDDVSRLDELRIHPDDLTEQKIQNIFGLVDTDPGRQDPLASLPVSKLEKWRLDYLYNTWQKEDWLDNNLPDDQLIIDPDVIGPDDFRYLSNFKPEHLIVNEILSSSNKNNNSYQLWQKRRNWIDRRLKTLKNLKTTVRSENAPNIQRILNSMYVSVYYNPTSKIPWKNTTTINDLDTLFRKLNSNNDQEIKDAENQIKEDLLLQKDAFCRLIELKNKHHAWMNDPQNERLTDEEWYEFRSILIQAQKNRFFDYWKEEENNKNIKLTPDDFWISAKEPTIGPWPPMHLNEEPLIDPEKTNLNDLPERKAGKRARELWQLRKEELITIFEKLKDILPDYKNALLIALGNKNQDDELELPHNLEELKNYLASSEPGEVTVAERNIIEDLFLTIEDFIRLMALIEKFERDDVTKKPSESEQKEFVRILTSAQKEKQKYPEWLEKENDRNNGIFYWFACKARLPKWRSSVAQRTQWQNALNIRNIRPIIDPDIIGLADIKNPMNADLAFDVWEKRKEEIKKWFIVIKNTRELNGFNNILKMIVHITGEELEALAVDEQNGYIIDPYLQQISLSRAAFATLLSIRKLIGQNEPILEEEWDDVDAILLQVWKENSRCYHWLEEEKEQDLILSPEFFLVEKSVERPLKKWRSTQNVLWEWQDKLDARIEQQQSVRAGLQKAISDTEELTLPAFRDALVIVHDLDSSQEQEIMADILSKQFFISMRESGCHITTRVSQAIVTIQGLLHSLGMDLWKNIYPEIKLESPSFDDDWKWMGSYATWRAAMFVFLYPENLLVPTLRRDSTSEMKEVITSISDDPTVSPQDAVIPYSEYLNKISEIRIEAQCVAIVDKENDKRRLFVFGTREGDGIYWIAYDINSDGQIITPPVAPWRRTTLESIDSTIIGVQPYSPTPNNDGNGYLYLFLRAQDGRIAFTRTIITPTLTADCPSLDMWGELVYYDTNEWPDGDCGVLLCGPIDDENPTTPSAVALLPWRLGVEHTAENSNPLYRISLHPDGRRWWITSLVGTLTTPRSYLLRFPPVGLIWDTINEGDYIHRQIFAHADGYVKFHIGIKPGAWHEIVLYIQRGSGQATYKHKTDIISIHPQDVNHDRHAEITLPGVKKG